MVRTRVKLEMRIQRSTTLRKVGKVTKKEGSKDVAMVWTLWIIFLHQNIEANKLT